MRINAGPASRLQTIKEKRASNSSSKGFSIARIAKELKVSKRMVIELGRKFQFESHSARVVELVALHERFLADREEWVRRFGKRLAEVESELAGRSVAELSTLRLFALAAPCAARSNALHRARQRHPRRRLPRGRPGLERT
jgi:hypothetical protein